MSLLLLMPIAGCSTSAASSVPARPTAAESRAADDGTVHVTDASNQFIAVEAAGGSGNDLAMTAPARVEFRDGALSQVGVPLGGRVVQVHVQVGDSVAKGSPLVTLDCPEAASIRASFESTNASLLEARATVDRQTRMMQQGVGVEREKLAAETRVSELEAEYARVQANLAFVGAGTGSTIVLRAPIAGTVVSRKASVGMAVQGSDPIVEVGDSSALWVVADVFEHDLPFVQESARVKVDLDSQDHPIEGRVASIGTVVATGLRTAPVRIVLERRGVALRPGMFGHASIYRAASGLSVPVDAVLIKDGKESVVFIQKDPSTYVRRNVVIAQHAENGRVKVVSGIVPGEKVVVRGALLLDGSADQLL